MDYLYVICCCSSGDDSVSRGNADGRSGMKRPRDNERYVITNDFDLVYCNKLS